MSLTYTDGTVVWLFLGVTNFFTIFKFEMSDGLKTCSIVNKPMKTLLARFYQKDNYFEKKGSI